jgi:hypothetical protein
MLIHDQGWVRGGDYCIILCDGEKPNASREIQVFGDDTKQTPTNGGREIIQGTIDVKTAGSIDVEKASWTPDALFRPPQSNDHIIHRSRNPCSPPSLPQLPEVDSRRGHLRRASEPDGPSVGGWRGECVKVLTREHLMLESEVVSRSPTQHHWTHTRRPRRKLK